MSEQRPVEVTYKFQKPHVTDFSKNPYKRQKLFESSSSNINAEDAPPPPPRSSWFDRRLDIAHNYGSCCALPHIIDVQPDFRPPLAYIMYSVNELYSATLADLQTDYVSKFSVLYYCQSLVVATLLFYDLYGRRGVSSCHATSFHPDLSDRLFELRVPNFMAQILSHLCPAHDAQQPDLLYVPSLAGFSFYHDFGRLVPPAILLVAESIVYETYEDEYEDAGSSPIDILQRFYSEEVVSIAGRKYYVTNFLGGPYTDGEEVYDHSNWIRDKFESWLIMRTRLGRGYGCNFFPLNFAEEKDVNPYELMIGYSSGNYYNILQKLGSVSRFFQKEEPSSASLGSLLSSPSGITIMSHSYSSPTLPTCHSLPPPSSDFNKPHISEDDEQFAVKVRFLENPSSEIQTHIPLKFEKFDRCNEIHREVLGFQPYGRDLESLEVALTLGLFIENGDIDGLVVSQPNPMRASLFDNFNLSEGALPVMVVRAYIPNLDPDNKLVIYKRRADRRRFPNIGFARGDMGRMISSTGRNNSDTDVNGDCYTYMAWNRSDKDLPIPDSSVYFWSSYRHVDKAHDRDSMEINFYFSLKALYGNVVSLTAVSSMCLFGR